MHLPDRPTKSWNLAGADQPIRARMRSTRSRSGEKADPEVTCRVEWGRGATASPRSRTSRISPTQRIACKPARERSFSLGFHIFVASAVAEACRRSEWPTIVELAPASISICVEVCRRCARPLRHDGISCPPMTKQDTARAARSTRKSLETRRAASGLAGIAREASAVRLDLGGAPGQAMHLSSSQRRIFSMPLAPLPPESPSSGAALMPARLRP